MFFKQKLFSCFSLCPCVHGFSCVMWSLSSSALPARAFPPTV